MGPVNRKVVSAFAGYDEKLIGQASTLSLLSAHRQKMIGECLYFTRKIIGDTAEAGVAGGGTSALMAIANGGKRHYACDTFEGLVDVGGNDTTLKNGMFAYGTNFDAVSENLKSFPNVTLVRGYFPESATPEMLLATYKFVHIDVDTYQSILNCFEFFSTRMAKGGMIALDDVLKQGSGAPGAQKAWLEILETNDGSWKVFNENAPQVTVVFL